jgi:hypothetical protein
MSFKDFVFYAVVLGILTQDRKTIKKDIIHSPDILAVNRDIPFLKQYSEANNAASKVLRMLINDLSVDKDPGFTRMLFLIFESIFAFSIAFKFLAEFKKDGSPTYIRDLVQIADRYLKG